RFAQTVSAAFMSFLGESGNRSVKELILQFAKGAFQVIAVFLREPAVESLQHSLHDGPALGFEILCQTSDERSVPPAFPFPDKPVRFLLDNRLGGGHMLEPISQGLFSNALQVVDVEQAGLLAVVNAWIEIPGYGDVQ